MWTRLTWVTSTLAAMLLFSACQDATEPVPPETSAGRGEDTECRGVPAEDEFFTVLPTTGTFDNVVVPRGATCFLLGSTVRGNVTALEDSRLFMVEDIVGGNVEGHKASAVGVLFSTVRGNIYIIEAHDPTFFSALVLGTTLPKGNIHIEKGRFPNGDWVVEASTLAKGNIKVKENGSLAESFIFDNQVAGDVQVVKNTGPGFKSVDGNTIGGNLQCKKNQEPFVGQPNVVRGKAEGQCAGPGNISVRRVPRPRLDMNNLPGPKKPK
jgi:hypothetical protein